MNEQRPLRARDWLLLASLYTTQFLPVAFFFMALPAILREAGMSLDDLTALYALGFVWVFKVLWAPLVDGFGWGRLGHHRGWLLVMQAAMIAILLVIGQIDGINQFSTVLLLSFALTVFAATQDIATDAIACRLLGPRQRGIGNGIQVGGGLVGMILGGGATLFLYAQIGWSGIFYLLASALLVTFCQVVAFEEPAAPDMPPARPGLLRIAGFWRQTGAAWAVLLALAPMGMGMMFGLMTPMMIDAGKTPEWIGLMQNTVAPLAAIAAVLATGAAISRFGAVRMLITAALVQALIILAFLAVATGVAQDPLPALLVVVAAIVYNPTVTILTTMMMARVGIGSEGTDFTAQYSLYSLVGFLAGAIALQLAGTLGYASVTVIAAALSACAAYLAFWHFSRKRNPEVGAGVALEQLRSAAGGSLNGAAAGSVIAHRDS